MNARRLKLTIAAWLCALCAALTVLGAPASAATPEVPETNAASEITNTHALLNGVVNPHASVPSAVAWFFDYNAGSSCTGEGSHSTEVRGPSEVQAESTSQEVLGLQPGTKYTFCLLARNEAEEATVGNSVSFTTTATGPIVSGESVASAGSASAGLDAQIDAEGSPTTYHVEYGIGSTGEASTPEASVGVAEGPVAVHVQLSGIQPEAEYHFRFIAKNAYSSVEGAEAIFFTTRSLGPSTSVLPDERTYELVSPIGYPGEVYMPQGPSEPEEDAFTDHPFRAAADGSSVAYLGEPAASGGTGAIAKGLGDEFLASRGQHGWSVSDIQPPERVGQGFSAGYRGYQGFSANLSFGVLKSMNQLAENVPGECEMLYSRLSESGSYNPLWTKPGPCGHPVYAGTSTDGSHLVFQDEVALTQGSVNADGPCGNESFHVSGGSTKPLCDLYDSVAGQLWSINVLPNGKPAPNATLGGLSPINKQPDFNNVISSDGSRVFWTDLEPGPDMEHIFARVNDAHPQSPIGPKGECTVPADACTVPVSLGAGQYWTASSDGRYVIYTEAGKLWRFVAETGAREELAGGDSGARGVLAESEDGSYVYFVADEALASNENGEREKAKPRVCVTFSAQSEEIVKQFDEELISFERFVELENEIEAEQKEAEEKIPTKTGCNLYLARQGEPLKFIGVLSPEDNELPGTVNFEPYGDWQPDLGSRTAEATSDGRHLVFESRAPLTGYKNYYAPRAGETEVFVYSAESGQLSCASCDPSGASPSGEVEVKTSGAGTFMPPSLSPTFMHRWISGDGSRVFFDTSQPLVPQDVNGLQDVYEWEQEGAPGCPVHASLNNGCVYLLSGGKSTDFSYLVDASADGNDVFFTTRAQLLPQDGNEKVDLYDARVGDGFPETSSGCTGTGCQGVPPAPPIFATPSSVTFSGVGNFEPPSNAVVKPRSKTGKCRRGFLKRHGKCVRSKATGTKRSGAHSKRRKK